MYDWKKRGYILESGTRTIEKHGKRLFGFFFKKERLLLLNLPVYIVEGKITLHEQVFREKKEEPHPPSLTRRLLAFYSRTETCSNIPSDIFMYYVRYYVSITLRASNRAKTCQSSTTGKVFA